MHVHTSVHASTRPCIFMHVHVHARYMHEHPPRAAPLRASCGVEILVLTNPKPSTLNPRPSILNPQPSTLNPKLSTGTLRSCCMQQTHTHQGEGLQARDSAHKRRLAETIAAITSRASGDLGTIHHATARPRVRCGAARASGAWRCRDRPMMFCGHSLI